MIRFLVLLGYVEWMMYLQVSGKLNQYINTHYRYLAYLSIVLALYFAAVQLILWAKNTKHLHTHLTTKFGKLSSIALLCLPLAVGFLFPTVSLDATIVSAKGFHFPLAADSTGDPEQRTQYLNPDTSFYYNKTDYETIMAKIKNKYMKKDEIVVDEENYLEVMEMIYDFPNEFLGKSVSLKGFVYNAPKQKANEVFLFRFGIIHCVADSGVFGLLTQLPEELQAKNNEWLSVHGTLEMVYYPPFKRNLPTISCKDVKKVPKPSNQYVYRSF